MNIKTVWHWKNIFKCVGVVSAAAIGYAAFSVSVEIPLPLDILLGIVVGAGTMSLCMSKWDCWHFE